jgi:hypothetical protein
MVGVGPHANALAARVQTVKGAGDDDTAARFQAELQDFVDNLDVLRYLTYYVGHGSDGQFLSGRKLQAPMCSTRRITPSGA